MRCHLSGVLSTSGGPASPGLVASVPKARFPCVLGYVGGTSNLMATLMAEG